MFTRLAGLFQRRVDKFFFAAMAERQQHQLALFRGELDRYNGVTVDSVREPCEPDKFARRLQASLDQWIKDKKRTIWFRVDLPQSHWIPELTKRGFKFHHAKEEQATLYRWLPSHETCNVPPYAHTVLGVGAVVLNDETGEILVVKEKHGFANNWKLPGGYVEPGEDLSSAVEREVLEETGVTAKFKCMLALRHAHNCVFGCSDIYMISCLEPATFDIVKCNREIKECKWMKLEDFMNDPNVHQNNRLLASKVQEYLDHRMGITVESAIHPINKKPLCVYSLSNTKKS